MEKKNQTKWTVNNFLFSQTMAGNMALKCCAGKEKIGECGKHGE